MSQLQFRFTLHFMSCRSWDTIWQVSFSMCESCTTLLVLSTRQPLLIVHLSEAQSWIVVELRRSILNNARAYLVLRRDELLFHDSLVKALIHSIAENVQDFGRLLSGVPFAELNLLLPALIHLRLHRWHAELVASVALCLAWLIFAKDWLQEIFLRQEWIL